MMTRKDYVLVATAIREANEDWLSGDDPRDDLHLVITTRIANALEADGGLDLNGNRRFRRDRFLATAGIREEGQ